MKNYLDILPRPFVVLAPMDDVTDTVFRRLVADIAPADLYMTEFTNVDGLQSAGRDASLKRLKFMKDERPLIAQLWGKNPENYFKTARELVDMGFTGVDINFGCPDKAVLKNGCGGAMIDQPDLAREIIQATKEGTDGKIPVSVKTRLGRKEFNHDWITLLLEQTLNMLSIHLRTVAELSKVPAHWDLMHQIKQMRDELSPETALVGNGDVENRTEANLLAEKYGIDGIMIGRGIFHDPFACCIESPWQHMTPTQKLDLYIKHIELFEQTWEYGERPVVTLNKFCKIYINDFPGAKDARLHLMQLRSIPELKKELLSIRSKL